MQYCSVIIALGGDLNYTVEKELVSVPEIGVLISIHGPGSVKPVPNTAKELTINNLAEYDRLANIYGSEKVEKIIGLRSFNLELSSRLAYVFEGFQEIPENQTDEATLAPRKVGRPPNPKPDILETPAES